MARTLSDEAVEKARKLNEIAKERGQTLAQMAYTGSSSVTVNLNSIVCQVMPTLLFFNERRGNQVYGSFEGYLWTVEEGARAREQKHRNYHPQESVSSRKSVCSLPL